MCMQCMAGAMTAGAAATGTRSYLAARVGAWTWLTPRVLRWSTRGLLGGGVVAAGVLLG
jgi:hypothetical protein